MPKTGHNKSRGGGLMGSLFQNVAKTAATAARTLAKTAATEAKTAAAGMAQDLAAQAVSGLTAQISPQPVPQQQQLMPVPQPMPLQPFPQPQPMPIQPLPQPQPMPIQPLPQPIPLPLPQPQPQQMPPPLTLAQLPQVVEMTNKNGKKMKCTCVPAQTGGALPQGVASYEDFAKSLVNMMSQRARVVYKPTKKQLQMLADALAVLDSNGYDLSDEDSTYAMIFGDDVGATKITGYRE